MRRVQRSVLVCLLALIPVTPSARAGLRLTHLGAAGWEITDGNTVILVDPYLTRAKYPTPNDPVMADDPRPLVSNGSIVPSDTKVIDAHISRADAILITHGHPDHTLDLAYIAKKTGAMVIGTESVSNLERALGVDARQLKIVNSHDVVSIHDVTVTALGSRHGIFSMPLSLTEAGDPPRMIPPGLQPPLTYAQHQEGGTLAYAVRIGGHEIVLFGSMNFNEHELAGLHPDIALIGAMPERKFITDYTLRLMTVLDFPRLVLPTHWDAFNVPYGASQQMAIDRLQPFFAEVKAASPRTLTLLPEHFKPIVVDSLPDMPPVPVVKPLVNFYTGDLWLNLHHFLYVLGRAHAGLPDATRPEVAGAVADEARGLATLPPAEQQDWRAAVDAYAADLSKRDSVSDAGLVAITRATADLGDEAAPDRPNSGLPPAVAAILRRAATAYRRAWWPAHHRADLAWMTATRELVDRQGAGILAFMTRAYQLPWPDAGYPVHVSAYTNWAGAYSTDGPLLVIASLDEGDRGTAALETVFHESMHQWDDAMLAKLNDIGRAIGKRAPDGLTHALIWMTAGEAVRQAVRGYVPIAEAGGIWERGANPRYRPALQASWLPYLQGRSANRDEALLAVMRAVGR